MCIKLRFSISSDLSSTLKTESERQGTRLMDLEIQYTVVGQTVLSNRTLCSGRRVFYSIATGRTTEIAEVSRRQPLEYWKIGPTVLTNGKLRREQLMLLESMMQGFCPETLNGTDGSTEL